MVSFSRSIKCEVHKMTSNLKFHNSLHIIGNFGLTSFFVFSRRKSHEFLVLIPNDLPFESRLDTHHFLFQDPSRSPEMNHASRPHNHCVWPLSPEFLIWSILLKVSMAFSFSDCWSAVFEWIRRASSSEPQGRECDYFPEFRSCSLDLLLTT